MSYASSKAILLGAYKQEQACSTYHDILISTDWNSMLAALVPNFYWDYKRGLISDLVLDDAILDGAVLDLEANGIYHNDAATILTNPTIPIFITGTSTLQVDSDGDNKQDVYLGKGTLTSTLGDNSKLSVYQTTGTIFNLTLINNACPCLTMEDSANAIISTNDDSIITILANQDAQCTITLDDNSYANLWAFGDSDITYSLAGAASITSNERDQGSIHL